MGVDKSPALLTELGECWVQSHTGYTSSVEFSFALKRFGARAFCLLVRLFAYGRRPLNPFFPLETATRVAC